MCICIITIFVYISGCHSWTRHGGPLEARRRWKRIYIYMNLSLGMLYAIYNTANCPACTAHSLEKA